MPDDLENVFEFPVQTKNVDVEELGEIFWDFTKRASKSLYEQFTQSLAKSEIQLTKKGQIVLTRQLLIINMWSVCKAWVEAEDALETMHQKYLRGVSLFFEETAKQEDVWAFSKKELMDRYKQYYAHWMNNDLNVSNEKIVGLAASMLRDMVQQPELILGGKYQSLLINHLKVVLKALLKMKREYTRQSMSGWKVFIRLKPGVTDHRGEEVREECARAGLKGVKSVRAGQAYELSGSLPEAEARRLAEKLLADPVTQEAGVSAPSAVAAPKGARLAQIWPKSGVSDPVADTVRLAAKDLKIEGLDAVRSGHVFEFHGALSPQEAGDFCGEHLMNALVQRVELSS